MMFCAHIFHARRKGLLGDNEWAGWSQWMRNAPFLGDLPRFWTEGKMASWFDPEFGAYVESERRAVRPAATPGAAP